MARGPIVMIADDLTGALDSAAPFCAAGLTVGVAVHEEAAAAALAGIHDVIVINTRSRALSTAAARARIERVCGQLSAVAPRLLFKKIDSRLQGPIAAEIAAVLAHLGQARAVLCPAVPDQGRVVRQGRVMGRGVDAPVAIAERLVGLSGIEIEDGEDDADMRRIARRLLEATDAPLAIGARGLAQGLAAELAQADMRSGSEAKPGLPLLLVIGSRETVTGEQVDALLDRGGTVDCPAPGGHVGQSLPDAPVLLVRAIDDGVNHEPDALARRLAAGMAKHIRSRRVATLFLAGGETAQAVLRALGVDLLEPEGEVLPGVPICRIPGSDLRIVTKSGSFGDAGALLDIVAAAAPHREVAL